MSIETLRPNAAGSNTNCGQYPTSGQNYDKVDEETPDGASTRVYNNAAGDWTVDTYGLPDPGLSGTINHVKVYMSSFGYIGYSSQAKIAIYTHNTLYYGNAEDLTNTFQGFSKQWDTNPNTGSAWTWDEINALEAGISLYATDTNKVRCTQVYVEVDYIAVTSKTSSDSGAGADAYVSLETEENKSSSETGSGVESTPTQSAILISDETGSGSEAPVARLIAAFDTGVGAEVGGLLKDLFASELGQGSDSLTAKIETPTKGGGMKLWT